MKINQFTDIGIRTLIYLTQPARMTPFTIGEMAIELKVSKNHLMKVVHFMSIQSWLITTPGKGGGVSLAEQAKKYRLGSVIRILEEHIDQSGSLVNCQTPVCVLNGHCNLKSILDNANCLFFEYLDGYTLADAVKHPAALIGLKCIPSVSG